MEKWELLASIVASIFTGLSALFAFLSVRNASKSNKSARKQNEKYLELEKQNNRPLLDVATKKYEAEIEKSLLADWNEIEEGEQTTKYASDTFVFLNNIGNKAARNVKVTFYYEGLDEVEKLLPIEEWRGNYKQKHGLDSIEITLSNEEINDLPYKEFSIFLGPTKRIDLKDVPYTERYGTVYSIYNDMVYNKIYLPRLFIYLNNILAKMIIDKKIKVNLILKLSYTDSFDSNYEQEIRLENYIRKYIPIKYFSGKLIPEETKNIEVYEK